MEKYVTQTVFMQGTPNIEALELKAAAFVTTPSTLIVLRALTVQRQYGLVIAAELCQIL